jgi:hypothetical protein
MAKHFVTIETILAVEGDLAVREIVDAALREIK